jgi:hypothetical protein
MKMATRSERIAILRGHMTNSDDVEFLMELEQIIR